VRQFCDFAPQQQLLWRQLFMTARLMLARRSACSVGGGGKKSQFLR
jgi:hypothetical protein